MRHLLLVLVAAVGGGDDVCGGGSGGGDAAAPAEVVGLTHVCRALVVEPAVEVRATLLRVSPVLQAAAAATAVRGSGTRGWMPCVAPLPVETPPG